MEKFRIWFTYFFRYFIYHLFFWYFIILFYIFFSEDYKYFEQLLQFFKFDSLFLNVAYISLPLAVLFSFVENLFSDSLNRKLPIAITILFRSIFYLFVVSFLYTLSAMPLAEFWQNIKTSSFKSFIPEQSTDTYRFFVYFFLACFMNAFLKSMVKRIGKGNYLRWLGGFMNKPREERRIFMFIDMTASTTIAEKLGHKKFSYLVQDIFNDLAIMDNYKGNIYQYLGDGAIISWSVNKGTQNNNCIKSFFAFERQVEKRSRAYIRKYGFTPKFKAGLHVGDIMILQIGRIRRDISYNGDTLNTTARIESMCNDYKQKLLISGDLEAILRNKKEYAIKKVADAKLKGKRKETEIFQVKKKGQKKKSKLFT